MKEILAIIFISLFGFSFAQLTSLPIEALLDGPIEVTELGSSNATLAINTSLDVACVVVFGEDENFGQMALDADMGADAHANHRVVMRGLKPETQYFYRFQGSDRDGNFYVSKVMSFTTKSAEEKADLGKNIALTSLGAKVVDVSSNYANGDNDSTWGANNAIDGNPNSEWSSNGNGNDSFITIELASESEISGFGLWTRTMGSSAEISQFEVINEFGDSYGPFNISNANGIFDFAVNARGKRFTFKVVDSNGGNTGVVEIAIYAK